MAGGAGVFLLYFMVGALLIEDLFLAATRGTSGRDLK